jgi:tRNA pseudouridine65 synthase
MEARETLPLLYQDERLVVVNKPSGLLVHRSVVDSRETRFAVQILRDQLGRYVYPAHRLDKGTSGALLFALDREAARALAVDFAENRVDKTYQAIVRGWPEEVGVLDSPLAGVEDDRIAGGGVSEPRPATTRFRRLATAELDVRVDRYPTSRYALLQLHPETGRRHQLRRHLANASHPIIGDSTYGKGRHNRLFVQRFGVQRLLLACVALEFSHPADGRKLAVQAPLADDFAAVADALFRRPSDEISPVSRGPSQ